ncbi:heavy metal-binding domain-containing protein [Candidatus Saccharibacteria bacterium]|nr:heavy metal-binding domain-containing protein [Candidatus Saccharibacteria bacterium]
MSEQTENQQVPTHDAVFTGLSGNEMYCADAIGYRPGNMVVGNSVFALGLVGSLTSGFRSALGGEVTQFTHMIYEGRRLSLERLINELAQHSGDGATSVNSEIVFHGNNIEFLSVGSAIHHKDNPGGRTPFTTSSDGQELFCQIDAGYDPVSFVFGNVAYSVGIARGILGGFRALAKGEVKEYSDVFTATRHLALERIMAEARSVNANSVVGIQTSILPFGTTGVQEMMMIGTAANHPKVSEISDKVDVITSDLTCEEMWNVTRLGYMPLQLVLGTSVYSLGVVGGITSALQSLVRGEVTAMTELIYGAREESLKKVQAQATAIGADDVLGIKTYVYQLGNGLIEFLAIGTAVKRVSGLKTKSDQLPPQAIINDKDTFINTAELSFGVDLNNGRRMR